jgi:hypothetical protein
MTLKTTYLVLCIVGTVLPLWQVSPWLMENGLNVSLFVDHMFPNAVAGAFSIDVLVSTVVLWVFVLTEGSRQRVPHLWAPLAANILAGVSSGLPLFLYLRERHAARR